MSLLNTASAFQSSGSKKEKFTPRMTDTFKKLTSQFSDATSSNELNSMEKSLERQKERDAKVNEMITSMGQVRGFSDSDGLGDFNPSSSTSSNNRMVTPVAPLPPIDPPSTTSETEGFTTQLASYMNPNKQMASSYSTSYGLTPYYQQLSKKFNTNKVDSFVNSSPSVTSSDNQLMEKLNYMIHLLEEQQKEPTQHILEEFLLYGLLGVFIIFLVDSFTRVGKYTR